MRGKTSKRAVKRKEQRKEFKLKERGLFMAKRTKEQIDNEYAELCTKWGDLEVRKTVLDMEINVVKKKVFALQKEVSENQIEEMKAKVGVVDDAPLAEGVITDIAVAQDAAGIAHEPVIVADQEVEQLRKEEAAYAKSKAN